MRHQDIVPMHKNQVGFLSFIMLLICSSQMFSIKEKNVAVLLLLLAIFSGCADSHILSNNFTKFVEKLLIYTLILYYLFKKKCQDMLFNIFILSFIIPLNYARSSKKLSTWIFRQHLWHCYMFICFTYYYYSKLS